MLNLIDALPEKHKELLTVYLQHYSQAGKYYCGNDIFLKEWSKNKKGLYKLLGGFTKSVPFKCKKDTALMEKELVNLIKGSDFCSHVLWDIFEASELITNGYNIQEELQLTYRTMTRYIENNQPIASTIKYKAPNAKKMLQISTGCAPMKALGKIVNYICDNFPVIEKEHYPDIREQYEKFRQAHSYILNDKELSGNLVFSILPLDFLTMSNNSLGWNSCMRWEDNSSVERSGCYHAGTIEMMNSNNVICCYLESKIPYEFYQDKETGECFLWNNKKWRMLTIVTPEIICSGKAYPYQHKGLTEAVLYGLKELAETNRHWTYQYGLEPYQDMEHISYLDDMNRARHFRRKNDGKKHNILFDTTGMYNDYLNDKDTTYYCFRNYVKKNIVMRYSGKAICTCCGDQFIYNECDNGEYYDDYNERYDELPEQDICSECKEQISRCEYCSDIDNTPGTSKMRMFHDTKICYSCLAREIKVCPDCGNPYRTYDIVFDDEIKNKISLYIPKEDTEMSICNKEMASWCIGRHFYRMHTCQDCATKIIENQTYGPVKMMQVTYANHEKFYSITKVPNYSETWLSKYTRQREASIEQLNELTEEVIDN